jgi:hypothetical protein
MIYIEGDGDTLFGLQDIPDMILELESAIDLETGQFRVAAYATDHAITEIEGRGVSVTVVLDNDALHDYIEGLYSQIDGGGVA